MFDQQAKATKIEAPLQQACTCGQKWRKKRRPK